MTGPVFILTFVSLQLINRGNPVARSVGRSRSSSSTTLIYMSGGSLQQQRGRKATKSSGRRHYDGWSPQAMALKAQLVALTLILGHLHGHRGHSRWLTSADMDRDLPGIVARWEAAVRSLSWPSPADSDYWLSCMGFPPTFWRTTLFDTVRRPGFCATFLRNFKRRLHGRFGLDLRRQISEATRQRESLRLKRVIASILQKDTELYALNSLQVEQGLLTDAPANHNMVTLHRLVPLTHSTCGLAIATPDRAAFQALADSKAIPTPLTQHLWNAFTLPLQDTA